MKLTESDRKKLFAIAMTAAARAGAHIQSRVGDHREARTKEAGNTLASQVVTEVDLESQELILEALADSIAEYELGLLTEEREDDSSRLETDYFWCIDPLDGTLPFIEGTAGYSVSIALVAREGAPILGVIQDPVSGETFHSLIGSGAFKNGEPIPPPSSMKGKPLTWIMDRSMKNLANAPEIFDAMERLASEFGCSGLVTVDQAGAALNGAWVTQHSPAVYCKFPKPSKGGGSLWDFAASACLLQEWGQPATDIVGNLLALNRADTTFLNECGVVYASHPELAEGVLGLYEKLRKGPLT